MMPRTPLTAEDQWAGLLSRAGLGLGTNGTSLVFLIAIVAVVGWFTAQARRDDRLPGAGR